MYKKKKRKSNLPRKKKKKREQKKKKKNNRGEKEERIENNPKKSTKLWIANSFHSLILLRQVLYYWILNFFERYLYISFFYLYLNCWISHQCYRSNFISLRYSCYNLYRQFKFSLLKLLYTWFSNFSIFSEFF